MKSVYIIAECGQGYASSSFDESISIALLLTKSAKAAGADAVKFQLVIASELATPDYKYFDLFKTLELGYGGWEKVSACAKEIGLDLIFDIFGVSSLQMAESLGSTSVKIHPTDFTNIDLIRKVAASSIKNIIAGCGGTTYSEIEITVNEFTNAESLTLLHGFQGYPTLRQDNCLSRLQFLKDFIESSHVSMQLGFADHADPLSTDATHLAATSLGYGVTVIEKHLTIAKCLQLEDHESALSPDEFLSFVRALRACNDAKSEHLVTGTLFKLPESEMAYRRSVSRQVVAKIDLSSNHTITHSDICLKRTSAIDAIDDPNMIVGKSTRKSISANSPFTSDTINL